jgi:hypothetical protein
MKAVTLESDAEPNDLAFHSAVALAALAKWVGAAF